MGTYFSRRNKAAQYIFFSYVRKTEKYDTTRSKRFPDGFSLALQNGRRKFVLSEDSILNKYGVYFSHLLELEECGLMTAQTLSLKIVASANRTRYYI